MFMTYKPKAAKNVKAEQITAKNIHEIAASMFGVARVNRQIEPPTLQLSIWGNVVEGVVGDWVVRSEDGVEIMCNEDFEAKYERARVVEKS